MNDAWIPRRSLLGAVDAGLVTHRFAASPRLSSYLVAFVIGQLDHIGMTCEAGRGGKLPVAVWATPDRSAAARGQCHEC